MARAHLLLCLASALLSLPFTSEVTRAELLWDDGADLAQRMEQTMRVVLPQGCAPPPPAGRPNPTVLSDADITSLIGYNNARVTGPLQISYEVVVYVNQPCFEAAEHALQQRVRAQHPIFSVKVASEILAYFNADGGPTFIFRFPATADEVESLR